MIIIGDDQVKYGVVPQMRKTIMEHSKEQPEIVDYLDDDGVYRRPRSVAQEIADFIRDAGDEKTGLVIDLAGDSAATTPDKSYGLKVLRELATIMYENDEVNREQEVKRSMRAIYGDKRILIVIHSKFRLESDLILEHWYLGPHEIQEKPATAFRGTWKEQDFDHSQTRPIVYSTYKTDSGVILPKIVQWVNG